MINRYLLQSLLVILLNCLVRNGAGLPFLALLLALGGCSSNPVAPGEPTRAPIRFLLTFDDGPSGLLKNNPTGKILDVLKHNEVQPGIKAIFFVQTRSIRGGATETGRLLLQREYSEGHLLAFHTATPHHSNHRFLTPEEFEQSLQQGVDDLTAITGAAPRLVRPPFWNFDGRTLDGYHRHGLHMLLTDLSAHDGVIRGVNWSWRKHVNLLEQLRLIRRQWRKGEMPVVEGTTPVVVTFHDPNSYTARNIETYLKILLQVAEDLRMPVAVKPFYDDRAALERTALERAHDDINSHARLPGMWDWLW